MIFVHLFQEEILAKVRQERDLLKHELGFYKSQFQALNKARTNEAKRVKITQHQMSTRPGSGRTDPARTQQGASPMHRDPGIFSSVARDGTSATLGAATPASETRYGRKVTHSADDRAALGSGERSGRLPAAAGVAGQCIDERGSRAVASSLSSPESGSSEGARVTRQQTLRDGSDLQHRSGSSGDTDAPPLSYGSARGADVRFAANGARNVDLSIAEMLRSAALATDDGVGTRDPAATAPVSARQQSSCPQLGTEPEVHGLEIGSIADLIGHENNTTFVSRFVSVKCKYQIR